MTRRHAYFMTNKQMDRQTEETNCQLVSEEQNKAKKFLKEKQREK